MRMKICERSFPRLGCVLDICCVSVSIELTMCLTCSTPFCFRPYEEKQFAKFHHQLLAAQQVLTCLLQAVRRKIHSQWVQVVCLLQSAVEGNQGNGKLVFWVVVKKLVVVLDRPRLYHWDMLFLQEILLQTMDHHLLHHPLLVHCLREVHHYRCQPKTAEEALCHQAARGVFQLLEERGQVYGLKFQQQDSKNVESHE